MCPCVHLCPPDTPTTLPPSTTPPLHPNPADHTVLLGTRASDPALTGNRGTVPPHTSPRTFCMILSVSLCASPAVRLSECFLLPCKRSFRVPPFLRDSNFVSRVQASPSRIQKGFLPSKHSIDCPRGIPQTSVLLCPEPQRSKCHVQLKMSGRRRRLAVAPKAAFALR